MKKVLITLCLFTASLAFFSCSDDDNDVVISMTDLPAKAQTFIETHFPGQEARMVKKDNDSYDVYLKNGFEIEFDLAADWDDIDGRGQKLPDSILELLPEGIITYVSTNYTDQNITEVNKEKYGYEVTLNNNLELEFDPDGNFLRIDH